MKRPWTAIRHFILPALAFASVSFAVITIAAPTVYAYRYLSVPQSALHNSCYHENWLISLWQQFFGAYCMGPIVEAQFVDTPGAKTVYTLTQLGFLNRALFWDRSTITSFINNPLVHNYIESNEMYMNKLRWPTLRFYFGEDSGVSEGYTIGEHTVRVLNMYLEQRFKYGINQIPLVSGVRNYDTLLYYTLAFHDIGKSIPAHVGHKNREVDFSVPMARDLMRALQFDRTEVDLAAELIQEHQVIGSFLRNFITVDQAASSIRDAAAKIETIDGKPFDRKLFFQLLEMVYVADAGSYPSLQEFVFERDQNGKLVVRDQGDLNALANAI